MEIKLAFVKMINCIWRHGKIVVRHLLSTEEVMGSKSQLKPKLGKSYLISGHHIMLSNHRL